MARTKIDASLVTPIRGTATNDSAGAGNIGEYVESVVGPVAFTVGSGNYQNVASISLTAGDWDVCAACTVSNGGTTVFTGPNLISINSTGGTFNIAGSDSVWMVSNSSYSWGGAVPLQRFSISGTTTVYLVFECTFTSSNPNFYGSIKARRVR